MAARSQMRTRPALAPTASRVLSGLKARAYSSRIPGVGSKTAKRIVVELSEKLSKLVASTGDHLSSSAHREAEEVLCSLGCTPEEARSALEQCLFASGEEPVWTAERLVIEAMKHMGSL